MLHLSSSLHLHGQCLKLGPFDEAHTSHGIHDFLYDEFTDMIEKGQLLVLPASPKLSLTFDYLPWVLCPNVTEGFDGFVITAGGDYAVWPLPLPYLCEIILTDPAFGPVQMIKVDILMMFIIFM
ncbi:LOW QUALITY PROTEIN: hypothetical protein ACHAWX_006495 [Stephanocyclus meneghinianus]